LVRKICRNCTVSYAPDAAELSELAIDATWMAGRSFWRGTGCPKCSGSGYSGRHGLFEWLPVSDALRERISRGASTLELRDQAEREGMRTLRDAGLQAMIEGITTAEEVLQYT
jgi:type IV pilus assembly protein PilB